MEQKGNKIRTRKMTGTLLVTLSAAALFTSVVHALTLDTTITRDIPYFQRLLITLSGDATSTSMVELSGGAGELIKVSNVLGTNDLLKAPIGNVIRVNQLYGDSFATGTLTTNLFNFDILSYHIGFGTDGFSDGSCASGEAIIGFSGGVATCAPATLISTITSGPLCASGETFIGWLGLSIPNCISGTGGSFSLGGGDYWQPSPVNPSDIYYPADTGSYTCESTVITIPGTGSSAGYYYSPVLMDPAASIVPTACHLSSCTVYTRSIYLDPYMTYRGVDIVDSENARLFKQDAGSATSMTHNILDTGYVGGGIDYEYGSPIPRCSCGHMGDNPITRGMPSYGCIPAGSTGIIALTDTAPYCLDVMHVGGGWFPTDTPAYNSTYGVVLMKRMDPLSSQQAANTIATGIVCTEDATGFVGVGLNNPLTKMHVSSPSTITTVSTLSSTGGTTEVETGTTTCIPKPGITGYTYSDMTDGPIAGVGGVICPCDTDPYHEDAACDTTGSYVRPSIYTDIRGDYFQPYHFGTVCDDLDLSENKNIIHYYTLTSAGPDDTLTISDYPHTDDPLPPRCACDINNTSPDCGGDTGTTFVGTESDPAECIDRALTSALYPILHLEPEDYPNAAGFRFNRFIKTATSYTPGTGTICTTTTGTISVPTTGEILSVTGTTPTFRVDNKGDITTPYIGAGLAGALTFSYDGANLYAIGRRVGINTDSPFAALDLIGNALFESLPFSGFDLLSADADGNLLTTGALGGTGTDQWTAYSFRGTGVAYYSGRVGIGTNIPGATLHVSGDILTNATYIVSDRNLKNNVIPLSGSLPTLTTLTGYSFTWRADNRNDIGVLAQEVETLYPAIVKTFLVNKNDLMKAVEYPNLLAAAIQALRELDEKMLDAGTTKLNEQNSEIQTLTQRISSLEQGKVWDPRNP